MTNRQLLLFGNYLDQVVNVASVPQRSPFRYPGGKTWLIPRLREWLKSLPERPAEFIEPFAGGSIASLTVGFENLAGHVTFAELDDQIAAVWQIILYGDVLYLTDRIKNFDLSIENVQNALETPPASLEEKAFQTILKNRVSHGGIIAPGAGLIKNGEAGKGIASRWYPATLVKRILAIAAIKDRFTFVQGDGFKLIQDNQHRPDVVYFIDPPYTAGGKRAGTRLYTHFEIDHEKLFQLVQTLSGDFLMTYDLAEEVKELAGRHGFDSEAIAMTNTHHARMKELLIGKNLDWVR